MQTKSGLSKALVSCKLKAALAALKQMMEDEDLWVEFVIQKGQIQYLNNRFFAHSRARFEDDESAPNGGQCRHMVRLWNRRQGKPMFHAN